MDVKEAIVSGEVNINEETDGNNCIYIWKGFDIFHTIPHHLFTPNFEWLNCGTWSVRHYDPSAIPEE